MAADAEAEVLVRLYGALMEAAGQGELKVRAPNPLSVGGLLDRLREGLGEEFKGLLVYEDGGLREDILLLLNNRVLSLRDLGTRLGNGDGLSLMKVISGG